MLTLRIYRTDGSPYIAQVRLDIRQLPVVPKVRSSGLTISFSTYHAPRSMCLIGNSRHSQMFLFSYLRCFWVIIATLRQCCQIHTREQLQAIIILWIQRMKCLNKRSVRHDCILDLADEEVFDHFATSNSGSVVEGDIIKSRGEEVDNTERQHKGNPSYSKVGRPTQKGKYCMLTHL